MLNVIPALVALLLPSPAPAASPLYSAQSSPCSKVFSSAGPLGAFGPLGTLGPIGDNSWNPSAYMAAIGDWSGLAQLLNAHGGPLSADGPLGPNGSLGSSAYSATPSMYRASGSCAILGPAGPLGALGPLGPLGPLGAHGRLGSHAGGTVNVSGGAGDGRFHIVEYFSSTRRDYDTSFIAAGEVDSGGDDVYAVTSPDNQVISVLVVPEKSLDAFGVTVSSSSGGLAARSEGLTAINWVTLQVGAGETVSVHVRLLGSMQWLSHSYRLIVTGAGTGR